MSCECQFLLVTPVLSYIFFIFSLLNLKQLMAPSPMSLRLFSRCCPRLTALCSHRVFRSPRNRLYRPSMGIYRNSTFFLFLLKKLIFSALSSMESLLSERLRNATRPPAPVRRHMHRKYRFLQCRCIKRCRLVDNKQSTITNNHQTSASFIELFFFRFSPPISSVRASSICNLTRRRPRN